MRVMLSGVDPAMNGTTMVTVRSGHPCALNGAQDSAMLITAAKILWYMRPS